MAGNKQLVWNYNIRSYMFCPHGCIYIVDIGFDFACDLSRGESKHLLQFFCPTSEIGERIER